MWGGHPSGADGDGGESRTGNRGGEAGRRFDHNPLTGGRSQVAEEGTNKGGHGVVTQHHTRPSPLTPKGNSTPYRL
jgi:hypothetical protein